MTATYLILPAHNRRTVTLRCLDHLARTGVLDWARAVVVDDGSTDGTTGAIRAAHPAVEVLTGDGDLFWSGAIVLGMRHAVAQGAACCVWLNDDSHPVPGAVERIVDRALKYSCVAAGFTRFVGVQPPVNIPPYHKTRQGLRPIVNVHLNAEGLIEADTCRGNLVAIPRRVVDTIGYPDAAGLPHYFGDVDYVMRAVQAGFPCVVDPLADVQEMEHSGNWDESWLTTNVPLRRIWVRFSMKQASMYWRANWIFHRRHWGLARGAALFIRPYVRLALISLVRLTLPAAWIRRLRADESR